MAIASIVASRYSLSGEHIQTSRWDVNLYTDPDLSPNDSTESIARTVADRFYRHVKNELIRVHSIQREG